ncbi:Uncharacterized protein dnl_52790 [Desulfonema limicola]|uniref:Uncharacterized protein n=1 Tax=Desulfonema limicola TaxID=45656 RepID=A0A975BCS2_9BACT|nr:Uncharacterized protein dnl_52790 [Desulfonema limicola]
MLHTKTNFYIIELLLLQEKKQGIGIGDTSNLNLTRKIHDEPG